MSYLACDRNKVDRARKAIISEVKVTDKEKNLRNKIEAISYDGRKDKHTRAMVPDSSGRLRMRTIKEKHESVTEEPSDRYLSHFVPDAPVYPEKPALKVAQGLLHIVQENDSEDSLKFLGGDSTPMNTGHLGGTHAHLEKLLKRKLYWGICNIHTNELPLRHLIAILDGPTCSDTGFIGPVCSLLSKVTEMEYDPNFKAMPGGEDLMEIPEKVLKEMSTDQKQCYKLVQAVKAGELPVTMQGMMCGPLCHARWLTTGQRIIFMWTRKHSMTGNNLKVLEMLVKFFLEWYFKLYFNIKVKHLILDAPLHILTGLRILKTHPKNVRDAVTPYIRTGAWYAHSECLMLTLLSFENSREREFAVRQILKLRGKDEYGDTIIHQRITPKLNFSATSLTSLHLLFVQG